MVMQSGVLVLTPFFRRSRREAGEDAGLGAHCLAFDPSRPRELLLAFRSLAEQGSCPAVLVLDIGRFWDDTQWAFVSDAVGRAGFNPLRGLGSIMKEPFVDVTTLYYVPDGFTGVEVVALGDRFQEYLDQPRPDARKRPACSHLHAAAILAHTERLRVSGMIVSESAVPRFKLERIGWR